MGCAEHFLKGDQADRGRGRPHQPILCIPESNMYRKNWNFIWSPLPYYEMQGSGAKPQKTSGGEAEETERSWRNRKGNYQYSAHLRTKSHRKTKFSFWPLVIVKCKVLGQSFKRPQESKPLEDREAEEVLLRPPTQRATANTKQCLLKVNPLFLFLYNEMKSTSNEP